MRFKALLAAAALVLPLAATLPLTPVQASSEPVKIEAPKIDAAAPRPADRGDRRRLLLGRAGGVPAHQGRDQRGVGLCRRREGGRRLRRSAAAGRARRGGAVTFDPKVVSYGKILQIFFSVAHNPTHSTARARTPARNTAPRFSRRTTRRRTSPRPISRSSTPRGCSQPIVTKTGRQGRVLSGRGLHQDYAFRNPNNMYIVINDAPKVENLKRMFPAEFPRQAGAGGGWKKGGRRARVAAAARLARLTAPSAAPQTARWSCDTPRSGSTRASPGSSPCPRRTARRPASR